jgi:hypothetical protein
VDRNLNELTDEELILEFQKSGNEKAFEILVLRFKNPLTNYVYRFLGDYDSCVDVVQDTFVKVLDIKITIVHWQSFLHGFTQLLVILHGQNISVNAEEIFSQ